MTRSKAGLTALLVAIACVVLGPAVVAAQEAAPSVDLLQIDAQTERSDGATVQPSLRVFTSGNGQPEVSLTVNGTQAQVGAMRSVADGGIPARTILIVDNADVNSDSLDELLAAATNYVRNRASDEQISVMTSGARPRTVLNFSSNTASLERVVGRIRSDGESKVWDSLFTAAQTLEEQKAAGNVTSVVLLVAGGDNGSTIRPDEAQGVLRSAGALLHVAGINVRGFNGPELDRIVLSNGGSFVAERESAAYSTAANALPTIAQGIYDVAFSSDALMSGNEMVVTVDGASRRVAYAQNSITLPGAMTPPVENEPSKYALLTGNTAAYLGVAIAAVAVALGAWTMGNLFGGQDSGLNTMLSAYDGAAMGESAEETSLANSVIFQRAMQLTEDLAEKQGFLATLEQRLEQANIQLKAAEAMMLWAASAIVLTLLSFVLTRNLIVTAVLAVFGAFLPNFVLKFLAARRRKKFVSVLPETLQLLAGTLKAGYSFVQGLESVSREAEDPIAGELRKIVTESQLGLPLEDAMDMSAERMGSDDWAWAIMAVKIQREVGGNLAELLMTVSDTMVARERLRRDVLALTAEGRISAIVLGALPILLAIAMYFMNPDYIAQLWRETLGNIFLGMGLVSALIGFAWMKKTIEIEI